MRELMSQKGKNLAKWLGAIGSQIFTMKTIVSRSQTVRHLSYEGSCEGDNEESLWGCQFILLWSVYY